MGRKRHYPGHIEKRGDVYRLILTVAGKRHKFTLRGMSRGAVERFASRTYNELLAQAELRPTGVHGDRRFSTIIQIFRDNHASGLKQRTQETYAESLRPIEDYFVEQHGNPEIDRLPMSTIRGYFPWRRMHPLQNNTQVEGIVSNRVLNKDLAVLRLVFEQAFIDEFIPDNPIRRVKPFKYDRRIPVLLTDEELDALLDAASDHEILQLYILLLAETGIRSKSEALWIQWSDVHFDADDPYIEIVSGRSKPDGTVHTTKSGRTRFVPLSTRLAAALRPYFLGNRAAIYDGNTSPWLFHHASNHGKAVAGSRIGDMRKAFQTRCERAGIPESFVPHDLRHRRCTLWLAEGIDIYQVKEAMGHSSVKVTEWYTHFTKHHLKHFRTADPGTIPPMPGELRAE